LPAAFYIAKVVRPWARRGLIVAVLMPLWAGYLVKGYAWKAMLRPASPFGVDTSGGVLDAVFGWTPGFGYAAVVLALTYLWLPFMVLPIYAGLERLPQSLLEASGDLGARPARTFAGVIVPMLIPSIAAGSIFTFSLSLGDYITPRLVTEGSVTMVGNIIYSTLLAPNQPLAAAYTLWPLLIIIGYLLAMRRVGAFESL
jgi:putative spermidine/putrescine transport system permease protein